MDPSELESNQNIIYITEEEHGRSEWSYDAAKELLKIYDEKSDMLDTGIITTQKKLWELTSKTLMKKGFNFTGAQCENKWKALKRAYRNKLERVQKYGSTKRPCPFEYEIAEILSKRPNNDSFSRKYSYKFEELRKQEDLFKINLNEPPGFIKPEKVQTIVKPDNVDVNDSSFVEEDFTNTNLQPEESQATYVIQDTSHTGLAEEINDLKKVIVKHNKMHIYCLKQMHEMQEKTLDCLERAVEGYEEMKTIEEEKLKQQSEIVAQMKVQNELLQKLVEKLF